MEDIRERLKSLDCKQFASHVRSFGGGWYESFFPLEPDDLKSFSSLEAMMMNKAAESITIDKLQGSLFEAGVCILSYGGQLFTGYSLEADKLYGLHPLEVAWISMQKDNKILAVVVAVKSDDKSASSAPCGRCRQKISEAAAGNIPIIGIKVNFGNKIWEIDLTNIDYLLPKANKNF